MNKDFFDNLKSNLKKAKAIMRFCTKYRAEFFPAGNRYLVAVPRKLDPDAENELRVLIPGSEVEFIEAPKLQTKSNIDNLIRRAKPSNGTVNPDLKNRTITISLEGVAEEDPVWGELTEVLQKDGYFDSWTFVANGQERKVIAKMVEELSKNQASGKVIAEDDVTNLKIALGNAQTIDDILKAIGG